MPELADGSVDLVVTSPPYWVDPDNDFLGPAFLQGAEGTPRSYEELLALLYGCFSECYRVFKPGGFCAVNVASTRVKGRLYPLPFDLTVRMLREGWLLQEEFIWRRWRGWDKRAGTFIAHPYPSYFFPNRVFEYVLLFKKPGPPIYERRSEAVMKASRYPVTDPLYVHEVANNIWNIMPVPPQRKGRHPCPFPEELAARLLELYGYVGDTVLDPFTGSGTTGKAARLLGRRFVGYERSPVFFQVARKRFLEPSLSRERCVCRFESLPGPDKP